jgi:nitrite reductase/ring-hydroxylating ferredoxin subunit
VPHGLPDRRRSIVSGRVNGPPFVTVARVDDVVPGTMRTVRAGRAQIALARVGDDFYALHNECAHLKGPLGEGRLDECVVTCPWHGWQYDVRTGKNEFDLAIEVVTYDVRIEDGEVRVAV